MSRNSKKLSQDSGSHGSQVVPNVSNSNPSQMESKMSDTNVTATETSNAKTIKATLKGYDLSNLKPISKDIDVPFTPAATPQDAISRLGNDPAKILSILNDALESKTIADAKSSALPSGFASRKTVFKFIENLRLVPTFASLVKKERGQDGWKEERQKQTDAILSQIVNVQFMMDNLKALASVDTSDDASDDAE